MVWRWQVVDKQHGRIGGSAVSVASVIVEEIEVRERSSYSCYA